MSTEVVVVPTGSANTASVLAAFRRLGADPRLAEPSDQLHLVDRLVLPGVGAFGPAMEQLDAHSWRDALVTRIDKGRPTLAICLGMQLLCATSDENPEVSGLGAVTATITRFPDGVSVPQIGWNRVKPDPNCRFVEPGWAYFANSYRLESTPDGWSGARTNHGGVFTSAVERGAVLGCQFHPELSGTWGAQLLDRWLNNTGRTR